METVEHAGGEAVTGACGTNDGLFRDLRGGLLETLTFAREGQCALLKVEDDGSTDSQIEESPRRGGHGNEIGSARLAEIDSRDHARFDLIDEEDIDVRKTGRGHGHGAIVGHADKVGRRAKARLPRVCQGSSGLGAAVCVEGVHAVEEEQVAEVKPLGAIGGEIKIGLAENRVGSTVMEKGSLAAAGHRHGIGVRGRGFVRPLEAVRGDAVPLTVFEDPIAVRVLAHEARGLEEREPPSWPGL